MPGRDGTGPRGQGPLSGRGYGNCIIRLENNTTMTQAGSSNLYMMRNCRTPAQKRFRCRGGCVQTEQELLTENSTFSCIIKNERSSLQARLDSIYTVLAANKK